MAAYDRRSFAGGAAATTLSGGIDSTTETITITSSTGWPTGSAGEYGAIIDRGTASEEKVLVSTRATTTLTLASSGRGIDGTTGVTHAVGATIELCLLARDLDEANAHIADDTLDHHSQYMKADGTRHDLEARHTFGAALGTPAAAADIATAAATGSGDNPAREDHVHKIGTGAISAASMFAAGVVDAAAIAANAVGSSELADNAVDTGAIADNAVTTAKIADDQVTAAKIADGAIDAGAKIAAGIIDATHIAADAVGSSELANDAVDTNAIADDAVTQAKLALNYVVGTRSDSVASGTDSDDGVSVSFGVTFASTPSIQLTVENNSNADLVVSLETRSTTGFTYRVAIKDLSDTFGVTHNYVLHWLAVGVLA